MKEYTDQLGDDFTFGVATAAYQIEGTSFGGCGRSHWDDFAAQPNKVFGQHNGDIACGHYHHWQDDLDLIAGAGFDAYRFSFSWPRLLPETHDGINPEGLAFYDRLIDGILERGLQPFATLYHWDLPIRYAEKGGWTNRNTAQYFADYTDLIMRYFGERLTTIAPINEPWCVSWLSHYWGHHAPGLCDIASTAQAMHYIQLAHGLSIEVMRGHGHQNLGCVLNKEFAIPVDDSPEALRLSHLFDGVYNRWFEDSIFKATYPEDVLDILQPYCPANFQDDLPLIGQPLDWAGLNYYTCSVIAPDPSERHFGFKCLRGDFPKTDMGWEIYPEGLSFFIRRLAKNYAPGLPIYVTENGMANPDQVTGEKVADAARIAYFNSHLAQLTQLKAEGLPIKGYFAWSLLDNFEWAFGYDKRFGIVHVDFNNQQRTPKASYYAWQQALRKS